jgi:hypothetical protein
MIESAAKVPNHADRRHFVGGSDARIIMGPDEAALVRLWREKRGEAEPEDLSGNLIVQLGVVTEDLNRHWYERNSGQTIKDIQRRAEKKFWRCVESGEPPRIFGVEPPRPRIEAVRIVDMSTSNAWAEFAGVFSRTRSAFLEHEQAKVELKGLMPEDAKEAIGHGIRAKRSKSGAISFDLLSAVEDTHASIQ